MRRILIIVLCVMFVGTVQAQKNQQKVCVRTPLRPDGTGNEKVEQVYVAIQDDNEYATDKKGEFSFGVGRDEIYIVRSVQKKGYLLADHAILGKQKYYSRNADEILVNNISEQTAFILATQKYYNNIATESINKMKAELERKLEEKEISNEEYRAQLQELNAYIDQQSKLVEYLAEQLAKIDFAKVEKEDTKIINLIQKNEIAKAEQMLPSREELERDIEGLELMKQSGKAQEFIDKQTSS
ncbi:MAG: hypothetical protein Q4F45_06980, partial [Alistipes sp.]|nr:hypothetical protein [Alistipes sp.]